jgi:hypothetical protein
MPVPRNVSQAPAQNASSNESPPISATNSNFGDHLVGQYIANLNANLNANSPYIPPVIPSTNMGDHLVGVFISEFNHARAVAATATNSNQEPAVSVTSNSIFSAPLPNHHQPIINCSQRMQRRKR